MFPEYLWFELPLMAERTREQANLLLLMNTCAGQGQTDQKQKKTLLGQPLCYLTLFCQFFVFFFTGFYTAIL